MSNNVLADLVTRVCFEMLRAKLQEMSDEQFALFLLATPEHRGPLNKAARRGDFDDFMRQGWIAEAAAAEVEKAEFPVVVF